MLFEKSKENLEIITWYHKSFSSAPRLSELGRVKSLKPEGVHKIPDAMLSPHGQQGGRLILYQQ